ncbi:hypothetical protein Cni_G06120 [Canna indica]|uniref:Uncharacterized protein n=1 Tax=Canna indica TaxID=4628 RepID=A0AAQ3JYQ8_9LILI|nr:hypothetical protein Cni_G06120 [Canna indica]
MTRISQLSQQRERSASSGIKEKEKGHGSRRALAWTTTSVSPQRQFVEHLVDGIRRYFRAEEEAILGRRTKPPKHPRSPAHRSPAVGLGEMLRLTIGEDVLLEQEHEEEELDQAGGGEGGYELGAQHLDYLPKLGGGGEKEEEQLNSSGEKECRWKHGGVSLRELPPARHASSVVAGVPELQARAGAAAASAEAGGRRQALGNSQPPPLIVYRRDKACANPCCGVIWDLGIINNT